MAQKSEIEPRQKGTGRIVLLPLGVYLDPKAHQSSSSCLSWVRYPHSLIFKFYSLVLLLCKMFCISTVGLFCYHLLKANCSL